MIRTAKGPILLYMNLCGFKGWTSFWNLIYMAPGFEQHDALIRHETMHLEQMRRDGKGLLAIKEPRGECGPGFKMKPYED